MGLWWQALILFCSTLHFVDCIPSAVLQTKYMNSYRLARSTRARVQQLLMRYKEQQLGSKDFEDRSQHLKDLPLLSTDFYNWLKLTDRERLHAAVSDMQTFWSMLDWKRKQMAALATHVLPQSFEHIQFDLRDLMSQVNNEMGYIGSMSVKPYTTSVRSMNAESNTWMEWDSRVEGYIILRDLDLYLTKLARDFLLLATKATPTQTGKSKRKL